MAFGLSLYLLLEEQKKTANMGKELAGLQVEADSKLATVSEQLAKCKQAYANLRSKAENEVKRLQSESLALTATIGGQREKMQRWQVIVDAEAEASRVLEVAANEASRLRSQSEQLLTNATTQAAAMLSDAEAQSDVLKTSALALATSADGEAKRIRDLARRESDVHLETARRESNLLKNEANIYLEQAKVRATEILAEADRKAREIAGDAYDVKLDIGKYERLLRAIKNELHGYGDEYIVPSISLLDELADEFGFTEAGHKLKAAREVVRIMVKAGQAASCDYVEANRRDTAVRFIVDAFNGKVDSTLALVKHDNYGKLAQQIHDAFTLVNSNGEAFRNARINPEYLNARLEELKWAVVSHELKKRDHEEQRLTKERMREEQKALREYERALREAKREEDIVQKALSRLQNQLAHSSAEERSKYENELKELTEKLRVAEEKGQRAISMAQQTRCGHVYVISNVGSFGDNVFKIGLTRRLEPLDRVRELGDSSVPFEFDVHALIKSDDAPALEHQLHRHFVLHQVNKVNHRKEFFRCDLAKIRSEVEALGLEAAWTMRAEARDYRDTLAIDKKIAADPIAKDQWLRRQLELELSDDNEELVEVAEDAGIMETESVD